MGCRGFAPCWGVGQSPASTKFNERSGGKIPFRVIRSRHTVRADFRVSRKRNSNYTLPRTCTHIPSMDMRERERFASQGAKRRGENTTHPLDPDKLTKMEPRVPSLHCNLKREQNPAFLVSRGSSYYPLCSTPRSRGRSAPMTSPRPWLMFSRKTTFAILRYLRLRHKVGVPLVQKNRSCKL